MRMAKRDGEELSTVSTPYPSDARVRFEPEKLFDLGDRALSKMQTEVTIRLAKLVFARVHAVCGGHVFFHRSSLAFGM
jgi:hypothetical protein